MPFSPLLSAHQRTTTASSSTSAGSTKRRASRSPEGAGKWPVKSSKRSSTDGGGGDSPEEGELDDEYGPVKPPLQSMSNGNASGKARENVSVIRPEL
jgi:hypothetical protein